MNEFGGVIVVLAIVFFFYCLGSKEAEPGEDFGTTVQRGVIKVVIFLAALAFVLRLLGD